MTILRIYIYINRIDPYSVSSDLCFTDAFCNVQPEAPKVQKPNLQFGICASHECHPSEVPPMHIILHYGATRTSRMVSFTNLIFLQGTCFVSMGTAR